MKASTVYFALARPAIGRPNYPTVCTVLALGSWKYSVGEQGPTARHIHKIVQSSSYS